MSKEEKDKIKRFLYSIKNAVMAMDIESLEDEQLASVYNNLVIMINNNNNTIFVKDNILIFEDK